MKTNKKAVFGFAVAMIFSLAIMQGISTKNSKQDVSMQQVCVGSAVASSYCEDGGAAQAGLLAVSALSGAYATNVASTLVTAAPVSTTTPVGWGAWISVGVSAL